MSHDPSVIGKNVYRNDHFDIVVEVAPKTTDNTYQDDLLAYCIYNRETGVMEYFHTVLYFAREWANGMSDKLAGKDAPEELRDYDMPRFN